MPDSNNDGRDDRLDFPRPVAIIWPDPTNPFNRLGTPAVKSDFGGGGGGGGASTIADGADVALGTTTDTPSTAAEDGTARTGISLWKGIKNYLRTLATNLVLPATLGQKAKAASLAVTLASDQDALTIAAGTTGGATPVGVMADGTAFAGVVKASAGNLYKLSVSNALGVNVYLRVYNLTTTPTPASQTPTLRYVVPPGGREIQVPDVGCSFTSGIAWSFTMGSFADTDVTPVTLNGAAFNAMYK